MESQQEVRAEWFPHVVLATVKISLPCAHRANRCCVCELNHSATAMYLTILKEKYVNIEPKWRAKCVIFSTAESEAIHVFLSTTRE